MASEGVTPLRWGILSTGAISNDFAASFKAVLLPSEHKLVGIAARNQLNAKTFAEEHGIPQVFDSYEALTKSDAVDVVYIGAVHPAHLELGKLALANGKHVLCEKPLCVNTRETKELIEFARSKKLFLMEAYWSRFFPAYDQLRAELEKGTIGEVYQVNAGLGYRFDDNWRMWNKSICAGSVLDIGSYPIQLASLVFGAQRPDKVIAGGHMNEHEIDVSSSATLIYQKGKTATLQTHCIVELPNDAQIIGTKGIMTLGPLFWCPTKLTTPTDTFEFPLPETDKKMNFYNTQGLAYQCKEVRRCIQEGLLESPFIPHEESIVIAELRETIRKQIGVVYEQD